MTESVNGPRPTVEARGLGKSYADTTVFAGLQFWVEAGESVALVGPSGCGKSTLLHILAGLIQDYEGTVAMNPPDTRRALVMQHFGLFPWKRAGDNLSLPLRLAGASPTECRERARAMFRELGLEGLEGRYPSQLSGGQRQRLALGRALIVEPTLLLLDEPFSSLDAITREKLQLLLLNIRNARGLTSILATHSIEEAVFLGGKIFVLGGRPTRLVATLDNPGFGQAEARFQTEYFTLVSRVRRILEGCAEAGV